MRRLRWFWAALTVVGCQNSQQNSLISEKTSRASGTPSAKTIPNDYFIYDLAGHIVNNSQSANDAGSPQQKLYYNNSSDPTTAPRWGSNNIYWNYNPAGQPSGYSTAQVLTVLQRSMAKWESVCNVHWVYQGTTNAGVVTGDGINVLAWTSTGTTTAGGMV